MGPARCFRILDNLPAAVRMYDQKDPTEIHYERGFPLGINNQDGAKYLFNHIHFVIKYHKGADYKGARIVGFEVIAVSELRLAKACVCDVKRPEYFNAALVDVEGEVCV